jgi:ribosomal protein S18 acetylase RimI-like enzyme
MNVAALLQARTAVERDLPSVVRCDAYAQSSKARRSALERWCAQGDVLLAELEGQVLGFVVLEHSFFGHGFIPLISVHPSSRRQGVARFLLAEAERHCKLGKLFTSANASNAEAQALFVRTGFVRSGKIENLDPGDPELVYFKALNKHDA